MGLITGIDNNMSCRVVVKIKVVFGKGPAVSGKQEKLNSRRCYCCKYYLEGALKSEVSAYLKSHHRICIVLREIQHEINIKLKTNLN